MFGTDLSRDYGAATSFGLNPREFFDAGLEGALCDDTTKARLKALVEKFDWAGIQPVKGQVP
jgi:aminodeoxyfutalosine deaminase